MIEIWQECAKFRTTTYRLADQVRTIIKKGWFTDLEILEIHQKTHKQNYNTVPDTSSGVKQKQSNKKEQPTSEQYFVELPGLPYFCGNFIKRCGFSIFDFSKYCRVLLEETVLV